MYGVAIRVLEEIGDGVEDVDFVIPQRTKFMIDLFQSFPSFVVPYC